MAPCYLRFGTDRQFTPLSGRDNNLQNGGSCDQSSDLTISSTIFFASASSIIVLSM